MPKLSIAIITYNHEKYISEALDSIFSQNVNFDFEIVIGEDYSTDRTREIVLNYAKQYPDKIRLIERERNIGSTKNLFDTALQCKGEYIAMMDGDDVMLPGKLQKQVDFLDKHSDYVMVAHSMLEFEDANNKTLRVVKPKVEKSEYYLEDFLKYGSLFANSSKMYRRSAIPFNNSDQKIHFIADMLLTLLVLGKSKAGWINEILGKYRRHNGAMMRNLEGKKVYEDEMYTLETVKTMFGSSYEKFFPPRLSHAHLAYGMHEIKTGNRKTGRNIIWKSISLKPNLAVSQYIYLVLSFLPNKSVHFYNKLKNKL